MSARVAVVLGTRPEAIKLAAIVEQLGAGAWVIHTGQHFDPTLAAGVLADIGFPVPEVSLEVGGAHRSQQIGEALVRLGDVFRTERPSAVVVQGDTNATVAGALAANAAGVALVHVEAGLRSHDRAMPEEHNRVLTDHLADVCCAVTELSRQHLAAEGIAGERVAVTGNTVVEAVERLLPPPLARAEVLRAHGVDAGRFVLATLHRPENVDHPEPLAAVLGELATLPLPVVLPMHPRTAARVEQFGLGGALDALTVVPPLAPRPFLALAAEAALLVSDSGGMQEEASLLKRPVIVVRRSTERQEVQGTFAELVPPGPRVGALGREWCADIGAVHERLAEIPSPYGDGTASTQIVELVRRLAGGAPA